MRKGLTRSSTQNNKLSTHIEPFRHYDQKIDIVSFDLQWYFDITNEKGEKDETHLITGRIHLKPIEDRQHQSQNLDPLTLDFPNFRDTQFMENQLPIHIIKRCCH